ncbi:hypothetical protein BDB01DRAFT_848605 [Pilobolus umbonatus]|nr:hypothetical protein BDB01DRAFT_848605 [Pilobolus umbonatus]
MSVYVPYDAQRKEDASFTLKAIGIQLGINLGTAVVVMTGFTLLRPRHTLVYAPKSKFMKDERKPPNIESNGWFSWIKPLRKTSDQELLQKIGCDALLFIRFIRLVRKLLLCMSIIGIGVLIPINIVATKATGDWPPPPGDIQILSLSGINFQDGKLRPDPDTNWYWSPFAATWCFSLMIAYFMYKASCDYIDMRQYYLRLPSNEGFTKSLIVSGIPEEMRTEEKMRAWIESTKAIQYPIKDVMMGRQSSKLIELFEEHKLAVQQLETTLASYLDDGTKTDEKKRPTIRIGGFFGYCGGKKVDAIEHYTKEVADLDNEINVLRKGKAKIASYGWISFEKIEWAHATQRSLEKWLKHVKSEHKFQVRLSPAPHDLIWANLGLENKEKKAKRWIGHLFFIVFVFVWMIPMGALSATSNVLNLIRLIPNSEDFIKNNEALMGVITSYFSPIMMAIFFFLLPIIFRFVSRAQGYWTNTTLDRKVLTKLYIFFIINNLLVFTLTSMLIGIFGQIQALFRTGSFPSDDNIVDYVMQIAKNISEVSSFWINFVCLKSLGLTMDLAMLIPLLKITIRKFFTRPSPRELREMAKPPEFNYPQSYNLLLFFFTIALIYSAMSPLILPFAFLYFVVASIVYKYLLMYIYITKSESGGKLWPVLFQTVMTSVVFFQVIMIVILALKGGYLQVYILIPLPFLTITYQYFYYRRMHVLGSYLMGSDANLPSSYVDENFLGNSLESEKKKKDPKKLDLKSQFADPAYNEKLAAPTVHEDVKHLLPKIYKSDNNNNNTLNKFQDSWKKQDKRFDESIEMVQTFRKNVIHDIDLDQHKGFHGDQKHNNKMTVLDTNNGMKMKFETLSEADIMRKDDNALMSPKSPPSRYADEDQARHLLQNNVADNHWKQQKQSIGSNSRIERVTTSSSIQSSNYYQHSDTAPLISNPSCNVLSPPPLPSHRSLHSSDNPMGTPSSYQAQSMPQSAGTPDSYQNDRNITSEYYDMYSSFNPQADQFSSPSPQPYGTSLAPRPYNRSPSPQPSDSAASPQPYGGLHYSYYFDENSEQNADPTILSETSHPITNVSHHKGDLHRNMSNPRRHSIPSFAMTENKDEEETGYYLPLPDESNKNRPKSLPALYQSALADYFTFEDDEDAEIVQSSDTVLSKPSHETNDRIHLDIKRSNTLPTRLSRATDDTGYSDHYHWRDIEEEDEENIPTKDNSRSYTYNDASDQYGARYDRHPY